MKQRNYEHITEQEMDILREAGNIAAGNAVTALGQLIHQRIDMEIAKVRIEKIQNLLEVLGDEEEVIAGMLINVFGDLRAMLILAFETNSAINTVNRMLGRKAKSLAEFDEMAYSVLCETGNILAGSYLRALNVFTGLTLEVSTPEIAIDMAGAILSYPAIEFVTNDESMLFIQTIFKDVKGILNGNYILILDNESYNKIIDCLGKSV